MTFVKGKSGNPLGRPKIDRTPKKRTRTPGSGRPAHEPSKHTRHTVKFLYAGGRTQAQIAEIIDVHEATLRKYYVAELEIGKAEIDAAMTQGLVLRGIGGPDQDWTKIDTAANLFWHKTRMGFRERDERHHTGIVGTFDLVQLREQLKGKSENELAELERLLTSGNDPRDDS
jgi:hypothetical protein